MEGEIIISGEGERQKNACYRDTLCFLMNKKKKEKERRIGVHTSRNRVGGNEREAKRESGSKLLFLKYFFSLFFLSLFASSIRGSLTNGGRKRERLRSFDCRGYIFRATWGLGRPISLKRWKIGGKKISFSKVKWSRMMYDSMRVYTMEMDVWWTFSKISRSPVFS